MISKILQILGLQPRISKVFVDHYKNFFLTVGQNNFSNKIPLAKADINCLQLCILQDSCWVWQQAFSIKKYQNDLINSWKKNTIKKSWFYWYENPCNLNYFLDFSGEKPYNCQFCSRSFRTNYNKVGHEKKCPDGRSRSIDQQLPQPATGGHQENIAFR